MKCLMCEHPITRILDTQEKSGENGSYVRRRRVCCRIDCQHKWWTVEVPEITCPDFDVLAEA